MAGFNSQVPHFMQRVSVYCAKVLPLVFDNSLSYYEFLCKMCHKLNEAIDAINAQNLNIIEFTKAVQLEIEKFEEYMEKRQQDFEDEMKAAWEEFKAKLEQEWAEFKAKIEAEWEAEKLKNEQFRQDLLKSFEDFKAEMKALQAEFEKDINQQWATFKQTVNDEISQFESTMTNNFGDFKNLMQTQLNEFEDHMVSLFNDFTTDFNKSWSDFQDSMYQSITAWESQTEQKLIAKFQEESAKLEARLAELQKEINEIVTASGVLFKLNENYALPDSGGVYYPDETSQTPVFPNLFDNMPLSYYTTGVSGDANGDFCLDENNKLRLYSIAPLFFYREKCVGSVSPDNPRIYTSSFVIPSSARPSWLSTALNNAGSLPLLTSVQTGDTANLHKIRVSASIQAWVPSTGTITVRLCVSSTESVTISDSLPWYFMVAGFGYNFGAPQHSYLPVGSIS